MVGFFPPPRCPYVVMEPQKIPFSTTVFTSFKCYEWMQGTVTVERKLGRAYKNGALKCGWTTSNFKDWTQLSVDNLPDSIQDRTQGKSMVTEGSVCAPNWQCQEMIEWISDYPLGLQ